MDKAVVFAVAGAGKTSHIIAQLDTSRRFLLVTYTDTNYNNLRNKVIARFGHIPSNIAIYTYYSFLYSFCFKPFLLMKMNTQGISYSLPPASTLRLPRSDIRFYLDPHRRLYSNRLAKVLEARSVTAEVIGRIQRFFDVLCVDEVQDFGGHDFNLLMDICRGLPHVLLVGDYHQHTYDTSRDGNTNSTLHRDYVRYQQRFRDAGLMVDTDTLSKSYRCSPAVCDFIQQSLGIHIESHRVDDTSIFLPFAGLDIDALHADASIVKLFYNQHRAYGCYSDNWGSSKGVDDYSDVCVALTKGAHASLADGTLREESPQTINKLYVACSRARGNLYLVPEAAFNKFKTRATATASPKGSQPAKATKVKRKPPPKKAT